MLAEWKRHLGPIFNERAIPGTAASDGDRLFLPVRDYWRVLAVDLATGRHLWSHPLEWISVPPVVSADAVFVAGGLFSPLVNALRPADGKVAWTFVAEGRRGGTPKGSAYRTGAMFTVTDRGKAYRLGAKSGQPTWAYQTPQAADVDSSVSGSPLVTDDAVVYASADGFVYCVDSETGELRWRAEPSGGWPVAGTPCADPSRLYVAVRRERAKRAPGAIVCIGEAP
jgi:outer membrane protein assembly factor BamB